MILKKLNKIKTKSKNRPIYLVSNKDIDGVYKLDLLKINFLDIDIEFSKYDALIFTSKNGVYSLKDDSWKTIDSYAISNITANSISKSGGKVKYIGSSGHGDDFANELKDILKDKKALYIRAKKVVSNLVKILRENGIRCDEIVSYETVCSKNKDIKSIKDGAIVIFSSPSTIKCFLDQYSWDQSYTAIAIGKTTAKYFDDNIEYKISKKRSIQSCVELAKELS